MIISLIRVQLRIAAANPTIFGPTGTMIFCRLNRAARHLAPAGLRQLSVNDGGNGYFSLYAAKKKKQKHVAAFVVQNVTPSG